MTAAGNQNHRDGRRTAATPFAAPSPRASRRTRRGRTGAILAIVAFLLAREMLGPLLG